MILHPFFLAPLLLSMAAATTFGQPTTERRTTVPGRAEDICPLLPGRMLPSVTLQRPDGANVALPEVVAGRPTLLLFYRGGWCPYCNLQLSEIQEIEPQLLELGYQIIAISPDRPEKLAPVVETHHLTYQLLSDSKLTAAQAFGLAFKVDEETVKRYQGMKIDLEEASGESHHLLPVPAAYLVSAEGVIMFSYVNPNYKVRVPGSVLLAAARAGVESGTP